MGSMKLFKILQQHVGTLNELAVQVYEEKIEPEMASAKARDELQKTLKALEE